MQDADKPTGHTVFAFDEEEPVEPEYSVVIELTPEELETLVPETSVSIREKGPRTHRDL
jgi:hypothetical protein